MFGHGSVWSKKAPRFKETGKLHPGCKTDHTDVSLHMPLNDKLHRQSSECIDTSERMGAGSHHAISGTSSTVRSTLIKLGSVPFSMLHTSFTRHLIGCYKAYVSDCFVFSPLRWVKKPLCERLNTISMYPKRAASSTVWRHEACVFL